MTDLPRPKSSATNSSARTADRESEAQSREKLNLWAINVEVPIAFLFVSFPLFFFAADALFRAVRTQRTLVAIELSTVNVAIAKAIGIPPLSCSPKAEILRKSPYRLIVGRQYRELFSAFPNFFVESSCGLMAAIAGIYVLLRLYMLVFFKGSSIVNRHDVLVVIGLSVLAVGLDLSVMWICSRALDNTGQT